MEAEGCLWRGVRQCAKIDAGFLDVHAFQAAAFGGREFHRSCAFHQYFAGLALRFLKTQKGSGGFGVGDRSLERDEELMMLAAGHLECQLIAVCFGGLERRSGDAGDFIVFRNCNFKFRRLALDHIDVSQSPYAQLRFTYGDQRFYVRKKAHFLGRSLKRGFTRCPPDAGGLARDQSGFNNCVTACRGAAGDQAGTDVDKGMLAGHNERQLCAAGSGRGQGKRGSSRINSQWQASVESDYEIGGPIQNCDLRSILLLQGHTFSILLRVEGGHPFDQRDFDYAFLENFSFQLHTSDDR